MQSHLVATEGGLSAGDQQVYCSKDLSVQRLAASKTSGWLSAPDRRASLGRHIAGQMRRDRPLPGLGRPG
jgi:hypothetical protein